ncbi:MAG: hypothetical protein F4Y58_01305 [Gammaproteobacteria bacterium]|nr:hypothetical protein [Gammaproteobacteria bacterium]
MKSHAVYAESQWIELRRSRVARLLKHLFYVLILFSITTWSIALIWQLPFYLLVLTCYLLDCYRDADRLKRRDIDAVVLSADKGVVATRRGCRVRNIRSFKIEQILCYYIQIYLCYENGDHSRLYIFPDSLDEKSFHKLRCMGVRYRTLR